MKYARVAFDSELLNMRLVISVIWMPGYLVLSLNVSISNLSVNKRRYYSRSLSLKLLMLSLWNSFDMVVSETQRLIFESWAFHWKEYSCTWSWWVFYLFLWFSLQYSHRFTSIFYNVLWINYYSKVITSSYYLNKLLLSISYYSKIFQIFSFRYIFFHQDITVQRSVN